MAVEQHSEDPSVGEGFAWFWWHRHKWPYCCYCEFNDPEPNFCVGLWVSGDR